MSIFFTHVYTHANTHMYACMHVQTCMSTSHISILLIKSTVNWMHQNGHSNMQLDYGLLGLPVKGYTSLFTLRLPMYTKAACYVNTGLCSTYIDLWIAPRSYQRLVWWPMKETAQETTPHFTSKWGLYWWTLPMCLITLRRLGTQKWLQSERFHLDIVG